MCERERERKVVEKIFSAFFHIFEQFDVHQSLAFETYNISISPFRIASKEFFSSRSCHPHSPARCRHKSARASWDFCSLVHIFVVQTRAAAAVSSEMSNANG